MREANFDTYSAPGTDADTGHFGVRSAFVPRAELIVFYVQPFPLIAV